MFQASGLTSEVYRLGGGGSSILRLVSFLGHGGLAFQLAQAFGVKGVSVSATSSVHERFTT